MSDVGFVIAGYGVILGGSALYAVLLLRRLARARRAADLRNEAGGNAPGGAGDPDAAA
jgi:uncharacterized membrane protein